MGAPASGVQLSHQPYPIADLRFGLYLGRPPWKSPKETFQQLENATVFRGRVESRKGYRFHSRLAHEVVGEATGAGPASPGAAGVLANLPVLHHDGPSVAGCRGTVWNDEARQFIDFDIKDFGQPLQNPEAFGFKNLGGDLGVDDPSNYFPTFRDDGAGQNDVLGVLDWSTGDIILVQEVEVNLLPAVSGITGPYSDTLLGEYLTGTPRFRDSGGATQTCDSSFESPGVPALFFAVEDIFGDCSSGTIIAAIYQNLHFNAVTVAIPTVRYFVRVGNLDAITGVYSFTYHSGTSTGNILADYRHVPGLPVMGIHDFFDRAGNEYLVACDTRRMFVWDDTQQLWLDELKVNTFTGTDRDFFWFTDLEDRVLLNNGVDAPYKFEPLSGPPRLALMGTDYDGDTTNEITAAAIALRHKGRVVYLRTEEVGVEFAQRCRVTPVNDHEFSQALTNPDVQNYAADAPTSDLIVSAGVLGDDIIVWFNRQLWRLRFTGDFPFPYNWERIPGRQRSGGSIARFSTVTFSEELITRGPTGMISTDGIGESPIDIDIPDLLLAENMDAAPYSQGVFWDEGRQALFTYTALVDSAPNDALVLQYDDPMAGRSWSQYKIPFHAFGFWRQNATELWDDSSIPLNDETEPLDSSTLSKGFPILLAGDRLGQIFHFGLGSSDANTVLRVGPAATPSDTNPLVYPPDEDQLPLPTPITMKGATIRLNPYPWQRARLGWVDFICRAVIGGTLTVTFTKDFDVSPYLTQTIALDPKVPNAEKVKRRVGVNRLANWHTIEWEITSNQPFFIEAIVPYFAPGGAMREVS